MFRLGTTKGKFGVRVFGRSYPLLDNYYFIIQEYVTIAENAKVTSQEWIR
jgi:hypothetical protein